MANAPRKIGLTMRTQQADGYQEPRDALAQVWADFLQVALPEVQWMYLPSLGAGSIEDYCAAWGVNGLILTGGEDIGNSALRDETERALLVWAAQATLPVLGICRGLQMMVSESGGQLGEVRDHVATRHVLTGAITREVNSYHSHGFTVCPAEYRVIATAPDGSIEAIRHEKLSWEGWMWHPEREADYALADIEAIRRLFS